MPWKLQNQAWGSAQKVSFSTCRSTWVTGPQVVEASPNEILISLRLLELCLLPPEGSTIAWVLAQVPWWWRKVPAEEHGLLNPVLAPLQSSQGPRKDLGYGHSFSASSSRCQKMRDGEERASIHLPCKAPVSPCQQHIPAVPGHLAPCEMQFGDILSFNHMFYWVRFFVWHREVAGAKGTVCLTQ